ncbi:MAG: methionyl-tRNA formyltransferase, partial [Desulfatiglandales bacterium]
MVEKRLRTIFMGTPDFAVYGLRAMLEAGFIPEAVVTQPDRPKGRGMALTPPPVKEFCLRKGMNFLQPEDPTSPEFIKILGALDLDLIVVIAYGHILKPELLSLPKMGCLNIHASLLPQLRGPAPIQWAIINGFKETGLTAMWMDRGVDTGNILAQEKVGIAPNETFGSLYEKLAQISGPFLVRVLDQLLINGYNPGSPQDHSIATFAPKITKDMRRIHWRRPAED